MIKIRISGKSSDFDGKPQCIYILYIYIIHIYICTIPIVTTNGWEPYATTILHCGLLLTLGNRCDDLLGNLQSMEKKTWMRMG